MLGILLAAGRGARLGQPKALLDLGGELALLRCLRLLSEGGIDELRVVLGHEAAAVRAALDRALAQGSSPPRVEVVVNVRPERGQTSSLREALLAGTGRGPAFLLHAVDHPLLTAEDVRAVLAAFSARAPGQRITVPSVGGRRGHPALFEAALAREFLELADDQPAHLVLRRDPARVLHVPLDNPWLVRDIDTPEDAAAARAVLAAAGPAPGAGRDDQPTSRT